jgi:hypothetical protein
MVARIRKKINRMALKMVGPFVEDTTKRANRENFELWIMARSMKFPKKAANLKYTLYDARRILPRNVSSLCMMFFRFFVISWLSLYSAIDMVSSWSSNYSLSSFSLSSIWRSPSLLCPLGDCLSYILWVSIFERNLTEERESEMLSFWIVSTSSSSLLL